MIKSLFRFSCIFSEIKKVISKPFYLALFLTGVALALTLFFLFPRLIDTPFGSLNLKYSFFDLIIFVALSVMSSLVFATSIYIYKEVPKVCSVNTALAKSSTSIFTTILTSLGISLSCVCMAPALALFGVGIGPLAVFTFKYKIFIIAFSFVLLWVILVYNFYSANLCKDKRV